jgi:translation initiation factor 2B subunit (eIF-2B alpha/beta/delta family)
MAQLRKDSRASAQEIIYRAVNLLIDAIGDSIPGGAISYRQWLLRTSRDLVAAQPATGELYRLVNDMLWACHDALGSQEIRQQALGFLQDYRATADLALDQLAEEARVALAPYAVMLTYSRSATLLRALTAVAARKKRFRVLCSEGRPSFEGQALASELTWAGIDVTLGIDMALFGWLSEANAVVLGARSLSRLGVVNKTGSAALVRAAVEHEVPCILLCTTRKFLPGDYILGQHLISGSPGEIMPVADDHLTVSNVQYDITPLDLISTVVTERGPLSGEELLRALDAIRTYPGLHGGA